MAEQNPIQNDEELQITLIDLDPLADILELLADGKCKDGCASGGSCGKGCPYT